MKNLLILYLILLSPLLKSQNNVMLPGPISEGSSHLSYLNTYQISGNQLMPFDQNPLCKAKNLLLVSNNIVLRGFESEKFSSLILKEQLHTLNQSTPFTVRHNATLERFIRVYLRDRKEYLNRILHKSIYYFPVFEKYLDEYDIPLELKYLAVVESALNPVAISPSGAKGLWQFMYGTGVDYNLHIDSYVDERFDTMKSTMAACAYLKDLYEAFGDWDLALAAYNSGPGNVRKAIKRAEGNRNYWEIRQFLPRETSSYVPAFYAIMYLFTHSEFHDLKPLKSDISYVETDTIQLKGSLTFELIEKNTGINKEILRTFNQVYKKNLIPMVRNKTMTLTLPIEFIPQFIASENKLYDEVIQIENTYNTSKAIPITAFNSYIVRNGDNLSSIAKKHQLSIEQLKLWNGLDSNFLISGQRLVISNSKKQIKRDVQQKSVLHESLKSQNLFMNYTVEHGDTLFKISRKFGNIPISELRTLNDLDDVNYLKPGTRLKIKKRTADQQS